MICLLRKSPARLQPDAKAGKQRNGVSREQWLLLRSCDEF